MNTQASESPHHTYIEVQALLTSLSEADMARLIQIYSLTGCEARAGLSAHDVLSEVANKVLTMERAWPRGLETLAYLVETGRSVISNEEKKYARGVNTDPEQIESGDVSPHATEPSPAGATPSPESQVAHSQKEANLHEWIGKIRKLFVDDEDATCFISQKLAEVKKAAMLIACKFTDQAYRNVEKRIKDKVRKRFPRGFPWWEIQ